MSKNHQIEMSPRSTWPIPVVTKQQGSGHDQPGGLDHDKGNAQPWLHIKDISHKLGCCGKTVSRALKRQGPPPPRKSGVRKSKLDDFNASLIGSFDKLLVVFLQFITQENTLFIFIQLLEGQIISQFLSACL